MEKVVKYKYKEFETWLPECPKVALGFIFLDSNVYVAYNNICDALAVTFAQAKAYGLEDDIDFIMDRQNCDKVGVNNRGPEGSKFIKIQKVIDVLDDIISDNNRFLCIKNILAKVNWSKNNDFTYGTMYTVDIKYVNGNSNSDVTTKKGEFTLLDEIRWVKNNVLRDRIKNITDISKIEGYNEISTAPIKNFASDIERVRIVQYNNEFYFALTDIKHILSMDSYTADKLRKYSPSIIIKSLGLMTLGFNNVSAKGLIFIPQETVLSYIRGRVDYSIEKSDVLWSYFNTTYTMLTENKRKDKDRIVSRPKRNKKRTNTINTSIKANNSNNSVIVTNNITNQSEASLVTDQHIIKIRNKTIRIGLINNIPYMAVVDIRNCCGIQARHCMSQYIGISGCDESNFIQTNNFERYDIWTSQANRNIVMATLDACLGLIKHWYSDRMRAKIGRRIDSNTLISELRKAISKYYGISDDTKDVESQKVVANNTLQNSAEATIHNKSDAKLTVDNSGIATFTNITDNVSVSNNTKAPSLENSVTEQLDALINNAYNNKLSIIEAKYTILRKLCDSMGDDIKLLKELNR